MDFRKRAKQAGVAGGTGVLLLMSNTLGQHETAIAAQKSAIEKMEAKLDKIFEVTTRTQLDVEYLKTGFPSLHKPNLITPKGGE